MVRAEHRFGCRKVTASVQRGLFGTEGVASIEPVSINMDERARENATMFAFGLRVRAVVGIAITESVVIGVIGTALGVLFGRLLLEWLVRGLIPDTFPDVGISVHLASSTVATAIAFGVVAVAIAPVFTLRRLRRMDIPSTLRVVE